MTENETPVAEFIVVHTFMTHIDADLAKTALEAAGIQSVMGHDDCGGVEPSLWVNGVSLSVRAADVDAAKEILDGTSVETE